MKPNGASTSGFGGTGVSPCNYAGIYRNWAEIEAAYWSHGAADVLLADTSSSTQNRRAHTSDSVNLLSKLSAQWAALAPPPTLEAPVAGQLLPSSRRRRRCEREQRERPSTTVRA